MVKLEKRADSSGWPWGSTSARNNSAKLTALFLCRKTVSVATVGSKSIVCIKLPSNARQSSIALNECIWCLGSGRLFDQVEILMDFSSPLTDEAGGWVGVWGDVARPGADCRQPVGSFEPCGCRAECWDTKSQRCVHKCPTAGESGSLATVNPTRPDPLLLISDTLQDTPSGHFCAHKPALPDLWGHFQILTVLS